MADYENHFESFGPQILDYKQISVYAQALDFVYSEPDVKNIAISGIYGSGKSTIWRTYQNEQIDNKKWADDQIIRVVLTDFGDYDETTSSITGSSTTTEKQINSEINNDSTSENNRNDLENKQKNLNTNKIEIQIINQILYQLDPNKIPLSKYKIKDSKINIKSIVRSLFFLIGVILLIFHKSLAFYLGLACNSKVKMSPLHEVIVFSLGLLISVVSLQNIIKRLLNSGIKINRFNIKGYETVLSDEDSQTILNQEIRELVYLIKTAEIHTVVFEDLDRFNNLDLFIHLRELNYLLNVRNKPDESPVRFIYMVKDELFSCLDRTKFFDFIMPVIPHVDTKNSREAANVLFSKGEIEAPNTNVVNNVFLYIGDMRLLKSIRNEYEIYFNRINSAGRGLNKDKLFAMIVLKNVFPREFDRLQVDIGYIYSLFQNKQAAYLKSINKRIEEQEEEQKRIDPEGDSYARLKSGELEYEDPRIVRSKKRVISLNRRKENVSNTSLATVLKFLDPDELDAFYSFEKESKNNLTKDPKFPLIRYLLTEGHIDETYRYYKGYHHEGSITTNDEKYIRILYEGSIIDPNYKLDKPEIVIQELEKKDYRRSGAFNYDLINKLINDKKISNIVHILDRMFDDSRSTLLLYALDQNIIDLRKLISLLITDNYSHILELMDKADSHIDVKHKILVILYENFEQIKEEIEYLGPYLSAESSLLVDQQELLKATFFDGVEASAYSFKNLEVMNISAPISLELEKRGLFDLTIPNLLSIFSSILGVPAEEVYKRLFSILEDEMSTVTNKRIQKNLEEIIIGYLQYGKEKDLVASNEERVLIEIINSSIPNDLIKQFIEINKVKISQLENVDDTGLWITIVEEDKLEMSQTNLELLWTEHPDQVNVIVHYMEKHVNVIGSVNIPIKLADEIINIKGVSDGLFNACINKARGPIKTINESIGEERITQIINKELATLNSHNVNLVLRHKSLFLITAEIYGDAFTEYLIDYDLLEHLEKDQIIILLNDNLEYTKVLLESYEENLSIFLTPKVSLEIKDYIIENNFCLDDLVRINESPGGFDNWISLSSILSNRDVREKLGQQTINKDFVERILPLANVESQAWLLATAIEQRRLLSEVEKWMTEIPKFNNMARVFQNKRPIITGDHQSKVAQALEEIGVISISSNKSINFRPAKYIMELSRI